MDISKILKPKSEEEIFSSLGNIKPNLLMINSISAGFIPGIEMALKRGVDINAENDLALRLASFHNHKNVVEFLLKNGANVHAKNGEAFRITDSKEVAELLLEYGANKCYDYD
jgi:ankyrin repeat protein